jgi:hypothetical protein
MTDSTDAAEVILTTPDDLEKTPQGQVKRWMAELSLAGEAEKEWRTEAKEILDLYDGKATKANAFNILWSNTETLRPAVYNSTPEPDVRRRFRDPDPTGKVASTILERSLSYQVDDYDFDNEIQDTVLDVLLQGRGVARIVYEPHFVSVSPNGVAPSDPAGAYQEPIPDAADAEVEQTAPSQEGAGSASAAPYEKIAGQDARCCHVQWDDYRHGPGKRWKDVPWHAFRHEFTQEMVIEKFGEAIAKKLAYSQGTDSERLVEDKTTRQIFKVCEAWEIWDSSTRRVLFIAPSYKDAPLGVIPDPLKLREFFPLPRFIRAIENSRTLTPTPLYRMYKQQAEELDRVSARINMVVGALKVRGAYSAHIPEAANILSAADQEMIAVENPSLLAESGGLDKLIWIMPIEKLAAVLQYLYTSRDQIKQAIYEITGIGDVLRGSTNPNETLGAQRLKSQWGSLRIQKIQREVQRFIRDLMRLKAEVISEQFTAEQLQAMTGVQLPDAQAKQQAQMAVQQAKQAQQPPPPQAEKALSMPTWDEIMVLLRSDQMRQYRVDIETDSTVADTIDADMTGLSEVVDAIGRVIQGSMPAIQSGMMSVDTVKEICLTISRRARLGSALEDSIESMKAPTPPQAEQAPPPPPDHSLEVANIQAQNKQAIAQLQEQSKTQIAAMQEQAETQRQQMASQMKLMGERQKQELDAAVKVIVAQISATKAAEAATAKNAAREFQQGVTA